MAERYIVKDKDSKVIFDGMAMTENEAKSFAHLDHKDVPLDKMTAEIDEFKMPDGFATTHPTKNQTLPNKENQSATITPKTRKPRSDKGQPHSRKWGRFFCVREIEHIAVDKHDLSAFLDGALAPTNLHIIQGQELRFERKVQFTLKAMK